MSGQLTYWDKSQRDDESFFVTVTGLQQARQHAVDKHTHVSFYFADGNAMHYRDIRQFGKWRLYRSEAFHEAREFWQLGLEPFDKSYTRSKFLERFQNRKLRIKSLLLNQSFVAGVGNIYADEALFEAGIHPERRAHSLSAVGETAALSGHPQGFATRPKAWRNQLPELLQCRRRGRDKPGNVACLWPRGGKVSSLPNPHRANSRQPTWHTFLPALPARQNEAKL